MKTKMVLPEVDDKKLWNIVAGLVGYQAVPAAFDLGLFSALENKPKTIQEVSVDLGIEERPAEAILITCLNLGLLGTEDSRYYLTAVARNYLLKSSPFYFGGVFDLMINNHIGYKEVKQAVLTNKPIVYGESDIFEVHEKQEELAKNFTQAMHSASMAPALYWPENIDLSGHSAFLDIGGGSGAHTAGVLLKWKNLQGTVLEIEPVCSVCEEIFNEYNLSERAGALSGNFWECDYPEADVHFYSQIFHDWPEQKCSFLSSKSFNALPSGGKIIIHEILMDDDKTGSFIAAAGSIGMLGWTEGKQYTGKELESILLESGFNSVQIIPAFGYWSIVVGCKN